MQRHSRKYILGSVYLSVGLSVLLSGCSKELDRRTAADLLAGTAEFTEAFSELPFHTSGRRYWEAHGAENSSKLAEHFASDGNHFELRLSAAVQRGVDEITGIGPAPMMGDQFR